MTRVLPAWRSLRALILIVALAGAAFSDRAHATLCGSANYPFPFTDVGGVADAFCLGILPLVNADCRSQPTSCCVCELGVRWR